MVNGWRPNFVPPSSGGGPTLTVRLLTTVSRAANGLLMIGLLVAVPWLVLTTSPLADFSFDQLSRSHERELVLYTDDGQPFARRGGCVAEPVRLNEIPRHFVDALLSMEDRRFYYHLGVDPLGLSRAAYRNWEAGGIVEGGSTITQQLAKFSYLSSARTLARKKKEALLALWLELTLSKDEILERYLSGAYFGDGCYGLRAAARHYFRKPVGALDLPESAYLVALLKSPTALSQDLKAARARAKLVLEAMVENGDLDAARLATIRPAEPHPEQTTTFGGYYADWIASTVQVRDDSDYAPVPIHTTLNADLQRAAKRAIDSVLAKQGGPRRASQAAMVVMRTDGRVVAMVGGRSYDGSKFNRAVQARRQPGSAFKLFVYLAALRAGVSPDTTVVDAPITIGDYEPENFGRRYRGPVSVRQAFASSLNTVAVRLSEAMGRNPVIDAARDLGISTPLEATPSVALGAWEVSLLELTSAYDAVAAGAYPIKPWAITGLGGAVNAAALPPRQSGHWRLDQTDALRTLLAGTVEHGSGRGARLPIPAYGKTGTSQEYRDAWFIGFAGNLIAGVWVGNDDSSPMRRVTGGSLPAQIWRAFMTEAMKRDAAFRSGLPQVAAFEARPRRLPQVAIAMQELGGGRRPPQAVAGWRAKYTGPVERPPQPSPSFRSQLESISGWPSSN